MPATPSASERSLRSAFLCHPSKHRYRYDAAADGELRQRLFWARAGEREDWKRLFFLHGRSTDPDRPWSLRAAQGAVDGAEYTAGAKGAACGHIFKSGESSYACRTCGVDETCVLCARCFEASDHEGHTISVCVSSGNSGCCDCGDPEAWKRPLHCTIHTLDVPDHPAPPRASGKDKQKSPARNPQLPEGLLEAMRMTIATSMDYVCDILSCSPEQTRLPKTEDSVRRDEEAARLSNLAYGDEDTAESGMEYALLLWNDEKHTVEEVRDQVARACKVKRTVGLKFANEVNDVGRSILKYSTDLASLIEMAAVLEQIKITVTIRSSRDTFREKMCATIIDWIADIAGCYVGSETQLLRNLVCEELLNPWQTGSQASNTMVGQVGIFDHNEEDHKKEYERSVWMNRTVAEMARPMGQQAENIVRVALEIADIDIVQEDMDAEEADYENMVLDSEDVGFDDEDDVAGFEDAMEVDASGGVTPFQQAMDIPHLVVGNVDDGNASENPIDGFAISSPVRPASTQADPEQLRRASTAPLGREREPQQGRPRLKAPYGNIPLTPNNKSALRSRPSKHWLETPADFGESGLLEPYEDIWKRVRLDYLILYDLRMWKTLRIELRNLYITTVVTIPRFKAALGLRFAGLYTSLAQLYLIGDREPDHSIINLSLQIFTTPTITADVVERGNLLTNLMAILFTFLTTRQVGFPESINSQGTLVFQSGPEPGAVSNRRMFHFLVDLKYMFQSELILRKMRDEPRYLLQFLDLVKLHQGICPNTRATGEHVEYESDTWIAASLILAHVNKLCKQAAGSFELGRFGDEGLAELQRAIRIVAQVILINTSGCERRRFAANEIKRDLIFRKINLAGAFYNVPMHVVQSEPASFHHPLHYMLSWLLENAEAVTREEMRALLTFSVEDLKDPWNSTRVGYWPNAFPSNLAADDLLCTIFDHPVRVCSWLAQIKAGMWVRNGITLRHQAHQYRNPSQRDMTYQRDILMLQAGFVLCGSDTELIGERFLAQMIDRFQLAQWFSGNYTVLPGFEEIQQLDVIEDFLHILIVVLSERKGLFARSDSKKENVQVLQHEIAHALCFKPLSFSDLDIRLTENVSECEEFDKALEAMTIYRPPPGLSDTGTLELKHEYIELIDPFYAHYNRNQREEAESIHKKYIASKTGKKAEDVVLDPQLEPINTGLFAQLPAFTRTPLFVRVIEAALVFATGSESFTPGVQVTRMESFLHTVLHLTLLAVKEKIDGPGPGFTEQSMSSRITGYRPIVVWLTKLFHMAEYASCHPSIRHILRQMQLQPTGSNFFPDVAAILNNAEAASTPVRTEEDKARKKAEAMARQAKILAQMKQQQNSFLQRQGLSLSDEEEDEFEDDISIIDKFELAEARKTWNFPSGNCILCQEETDEHRLYGTFQYTSENNVLRSTPVNDEDFVKEVINTPVNLDRSADHLRPFGVAGENKRQVAKHAADGTRTTQVRQGLSKGFPHQHRIRAPVATSCGHMMHFACFQAYIQSTSARHRQQLVRKHPERLDQMEFVCPLCKALGNTFLPIIWKTKECATDLEIHAAKDFQDWLVDIEQFEHNEIMQPWPDPKVFPDGNAARAQEAGRKRAYKSVEGILDPAEIQYFQRRGVGSEESFSKPPSRVSSTLGNILGMGQSSPTTSVPVSDRPSKLGKAKDLSVAYWRIGKTIENNFNGSSYASSKKFVRTLGTSITSFEIANRGVGGDPTATSWIVNVPEPVLAHLRTLSETIESYIAISFLGPDLSDTVRGVSELKELMTAHLFGIKGVDLDMPLHTGPPFDASELFHDDIFLFFADWLSLYSPDVAEATSILSLCYWAEIVKTVYVYWQTAERLHGSVGLIADSAAVVQQDVSEQFKKAVEIIRGLSQWPEHERLTEAHFSFIRVIVDRYALAFLRKGILLMYVRYGLDYECPHNVDCNAPELDRLTALLHIPSIDELCTIYTGQTRGGVKLRNHVTRWWLKHARSLSVRVASDMPIELAHPAIYELVGLPKHYDMLTEEAARRKCPTTGKDLTDPVVCLACAEIFCSQAECCRKDGKGGIYQHMIMHQETAGVFIHIRKCNVLFAHGPGGGSFHQAPYLDRHGEADPSLRRRQQLFLNQKRYDKLLRETWLGHMIPTVVARKLEGEINPGGWESL